MPTIKAIVFDLDGLMIDSEPLARNAWDRVLRDHGLTLDEKTFRSMIGLRLEESSNLVKDKFKLTDPASDLARDEQRHMSRIMRQGIPVMPGLERLLEAIAGRGLPWGVATSSRHSYAVQALDQLGLLDRCSAVAGGDEVDRGKPFPDVYLLAAERLEVEPTLCLALEDSVPGLMACAAAGMRTVAVPNGATVHMTFSEAHFIFDSLVEVADELDLLIN